MEKQICPECGAPLNPNEHNEVCPECGFPLHNRNLTETPMDTNVKPTEATAQSDCAESEISADIAKIGCCKTWEKHCKSESNFTTIFTAIFFITMAAAIAVGIGFAIHLFVRKNAVNDKLLLILEFYKKTRKFTLAVAILAAVAALFDSLEKCVELILCSTWLRKNKVDVYKCAMLTSFSASSQKRKSAILHPIEIAYCAIDKEQSAKFIIAYILKAVLTAALYITAGFFASIAINQLFILYDTALFDPYKGFGYLAGTIAATGLPGILTSIINKFVYEPMISWASGRTSV